MCENPGEKDPKCQDSSTEGTQMDRRTKLARKKLQIDQFSVPNGTKFFEKYLDQSVLLAVNHGKHSSAETNKYLNKHHQKST